MARIFDLSGTAGREAGLVAALDALAGGRLVAMPTETVYGLAADAANPRAVAAIYAAKERPRFNPLIAHVASLAMAARLVRFDARAEALARRFWPGPLTLVLPRRPDAPIADLALAGLATVAVRQPDHPVAAELIGRFGRALVAPSANRSGRLSPTQADHVAADLGAAVDVILDAGPTRIGLESTIVGFDGGEPVLLRPGGLARAAIEAVLGARLADPKAGDVPLAPGMLASHYAPAATLRLDVETLEPGEALLAFGPVPAPLAAAADVIRNLSPNGDLIEAAANLFKALHELDGEAGRIAVMAIPDVGLGEAINDRLRRAASPRP